VLAAGTIPIDPKPNLSGVSSATAARPAQVAVVQYNPFESADGSVLSQARAELSPATVTSETQQPPDRFADSVLNARADPK
jgi:hypothetical protein